MSKAKDEYYKLKADVFLASHDGLVPAVENYVSELEAENNTLKLEQKQCLLCTAKHKEEKAELIEALKDCRECGNCFDKNCSPNNLLKKQEG